MTLIAGTILPNGIIMMSDTRAIDSEGHPCEEYRRKIIEVTPKTLVGTSGTGFTVLAALAKRQDLYDKSENMKTGEIRESLIDQYLELYEPYRTTNDTFGSFLIADYDSTSNTYSLLSQINDDSLSFKNVTDTALIGSTPTLRDFAKSNIQDLLKGFTTEQIADPDFFMRFSHRVKIIFELYSKQDHTINDKLYCEYLTVRNNKLTILKYLIETNDSIHLIDKKYDGLAIVKQSN
ncbi:hypothetical protein [Bacillus paramobilis]|uniref:hypothetical protein n=1 Tax=Bacillus paramobilis TaxID=2817477 RepID=UPI003216E588